jgi:hypothetical protein
MVTEQDNDYREGDEDTVSKESEESKQDVVVKIHSKDGEIKELPEFAILIVSYSGGRLEAATKLPDMPMKREANLRDIRDACHTMYCDVNTTLVARATSHETALQLAEASKQAHIRQMVMKQSGKGNSGRRRK